METHANPSSASVELPFDLAQWYHGIEGEYAAPMERIRKAEGTAFYPGEMKIFWGIYGRFMVPVSLAYLGSMLANNSMNFLGLVIAFFVCFIILMLLWLTWGGKAFRHKMKREDEMAANDYRVAKVYWWSEVAKHIKRSTGADADHRQFTDRIVFIHEGKERSFRAQGLHGNRVLLIASSE